MTTMSTEFKYLCEPFFVPLTEQNLNQKCLFVLLLMQTVLTIHQITEAEDNGSHDWRL